MLSSLLSALVLSAFSFCCLCSLVFLFFCSLALLSLACAAGCAVQASKHTGFAVRDIVPCKFYHNERNRSAAVESCALMLLSYAVVNVSLQFLLSFPCGLCFSAPSPWPLALTRASVLRTGADLPGRPHFLPCGSGGRRELITPVAAITMNDVSRCRASATSRLLCFVRVKNMCDDVMPCFVCCDRDCALVFVGRIAFRRTFREFEV